ncbi:hypothetical protein K2173_019893 [Erythroxylum novogranatense]|uniref:Uncharacterized protein n=1 Tax=Erythroxylum novogranatense TaxID=1862640 RepID=A0AAV8U9S4_9ROSI|nr:hypothetical protein K2173_019893 [Erythroxylum novogranatense]
MSSISKKKISVKTTLRSITSRIRRRSSMAASRRRLRSLTRKPQTTIPNNGQARSRVSDKLEALKNLIPTQNGDSMKADRLFQETADYIVRLRTQVFVLQRMIEFYESTSTGSDETVL